MYLKPSSEVVIGESGEIFIDYLEAETNGNTPRNYTTGFRKLMTLMDLDSERLYEGYRGAFDRGDSRRVRILDNKVKKTIKSIFEVHGQSPTGANHAYNSFRAFMLANFDEDKGEFNNSAWNKWRRKNIPTTDSQLKRAKKTEIRDWVDTFNRYSRTDLNRSRNLAILYVLKDSALACVDLVKLNIENVSGILADPERKFHALYDHELKGYRQKTGQRVVPVIGYEAIDAIREYMEVRRGWVHSAKSDTLGTSGLMTEGEITSKSPLFIMTRENPLQRVRFGGRMTAGSVGALFTNIRKSANLETSAHSMRSFNWTALETARFPFNWACLLHGRKTKGHSSGHYTLNANEEGDVKKLVEEYASVYDTLRVNLRLVDDVELNKMWAEIDRVRRAVLDRDADVRAWRG